MTKHLLSTEEPRHSTGGTCHRCEFVGNIAGCDVYWCPQLGAPTPTIIVVDCPGTDRSGLGQAKFFACDHESMPIEERLPFLVGYAYHLGRVKQ